MKTYLSVFPTMKSLDGGKKENKASKNDTAEKCDCVATEPEKIDFSNVLIKYLFRLIY